MAAIENRINDGTVAPWLVREITEAIAALNVAEPWAIREVEKALLTTAEPLTGLKSREADELWKLIGGARATASKVVFETRLVVGLNNLEHRFGNGHNGHSKRDQGNGRPTKSARSIPSGELSPFAGEPLSAEDAEADRSRRRSFEMAAGAGGQTVRRNGPVPGTRRRGASSKKT